MPRLVRSLYLDTNVYVSAVRPGPLRGPSAALFALVKGRRLAIVGSALVHQELVVVQGRLGEEAPLRAYWQLVSLEVPRSREVRRLGARYVSTIGLKSADAEHLACATHVGVDTFVSWNRQDLLRKRTIETANVVNAAGGLLTPAIVSPQEFVSRARPTGRLGRVRLDE